MVVRALVPVYYWLNALPNPKAISAALVGSLVKVWVCKV